MMSKLSLTNFQLKIIGVVLTVLYSLSTFLELPAWIGWLGALAAPIFIFTTVEGFKHTSSQSSYLFRLLAAFWLMGIGNLIVTQALPSSEFLVLGNVFGTLFLAALYMWIVDRLIAYIKQRNIIAIICAFIWLFIPILVSLLMILFVGHSTALSMYVTVIPNVFLNDNSVMLILLGLLFYIFYQKKTLQIIALILVSVVTLILQPANADIFTEGYQWMMVFASVFIALYNGRKGRDMKLFFYLFYPIQLYLCYLIYVMQ